jgi:hypothetical protein
MGSNPGVPSLLMEQLKLANEGSVALPYRTIGSFPVLRNTVLAWPSVPVELKSGRAALAQSSLDAPRTSDRAEGGPMNSSVPAVRCAPLQQARPREPESGSQGRCKTKRT